MRMISNDLFDILLPRRVTESLNHSHSKYIYNCIIFDRNNFANSTNQQSAEESEKIFDIFTLFSKTQQTYTFFF